MKSNENTNGLPSIFDYSGRGSTARWGCPPCVKNGAKVYDHHYNLRGSLDTHPWDRYRRYMAESILTFDFGTNEEGAQQARHKIEGWKQGFRLGSKMILKFERVNGTEEAAEAEGAAAEEESSKKKSAAKKRVAKED